MIYYQTICKSCSDKLELLYIFWNSSQEAGNKLQAQYVQQISNSASETISAAMKQIANSEAIPLRVKVKEEIDDGYVIINQIYDDEDFDENESEETPPLESKICSPTVSEEFRISQKSDDDKYEAKPLNKVEPKSNISDSNEDEPLSPFVDLPDTSVHELQAGASGVRKDGAPFNVCAKEEIEIVEENLLEKIRKEEEEEKSKDIIEESSKKEQILKCNYCNKICLTNHGLIIHKTSHTGENVYKCDLCPKIFSRASSFRHHYRTSHMYNGAFPCETCNKKFSEKTRLKRHLKIHAPRREKYICEYCDENFVNKQRFRQHILRHNKEYKCGVCLAVFSENNLLTAHMDESHKKYPCNICDKVFYFYGSMYNHFLRNHKERFKCDICSKLFTFTTLPQLQLHQNSHTKKVEYCCEVCGKIYFHPKTFKRHANTHDVAKTVKCEECHKEFSQTVLLNIHQCRKKVVR